MIFILLRLFILARLIIFFLLELSVLDLLVELKLIGAIHEIVKVITCSEAKYFHTSLKIIFE